MILRKMILKTKLMEKRRLCFLTWSHHRSQSPKSLEKLNHQSGNKTRRVLQQNGLNIAVRCTLNRCLLLALNRSDDGSFLCPLLRLFQSKFSQFQITKEFGFES